MFKTILMAATAALVATAVAAPAHAWIIMNGSGANGVELNGGSGNGRELNGAGQNGAGQNGIIRNGERPNGYSTQGRELNSREHQGTSTGAVGFAIDGIELPARTL